MNYEELLKNKRAAAQVIEMPLGNLVRLGDGTKLNTYMVARFDMFNAIGFMGGLKNESATIGKMNLKAQVPYQLAELRQKGKPNTLVFDIGPDIYTSLRDFCSDNMSTVGGTSFISDMTKELAETLRELHAAGIYHVCFAPETMVVKRGDRHVKMISHGSFYNSVGDRDRLYQGFEEYIAPEVMAGEDPTAASDVYGFGRLLEYCFTIAAMPYEYKRVLKKATAADKEERYQSIDEMMADVSKLRQSKTSVITFVAAVIIALIGVGLYFELLPEGNTVEYVTPANDIPTDEDLLSSGFDPMTELGVYQVDSTGAKSAAEREREMNDFQQKAEEIFRKRFEREANRLLSRVYNSQSTQLTEKRLLAEAENVTSELNEIKEQLASQCQLSPLTAEKIAVEVIEKVSAEKQEALMKEQRENE